MADEKKDKTKDKTKVDQGAHQTDLAEGEPDTVEESIKIHERKKDEQGTKRDKAA